ncbi:hypothetical protein EMCG_03579, partial [[Emmonsia] crescens]
MNLKSNEENSLNDAEFRRTIDFDVCTDAIDEEIVSISFSMNVKSESETLFNFRKCDEEEFKISFLSDSSQQRESEDNRSDLSDNSDLINFSDCSSSDDKDENDEMYQKSNDDNHVTRQLC